MLKSPHLIGHGDFRETHRGVPGGVFADNLLKQLCVQQLQQNSATCDGDIWFRSYSSSTTTQIEGEICTRRRLRVTSAHAYIHIDTQSTYHRVVGPDLVGLPVGCPVRGSPPHGIRGASNIFEDQVAVVAWLETFMCTDPPRRDSRLRFLVFSQDSRDALLPPRSSTTRQDASLHAVHQNPDLDLYIVTR